MKSEIQFRYWRYLISVIKCTNPFLCNTVSILKQDSDASLSSLSLVEQISVYVDGPIELLDFVTS